MVLDRSLYDEKIHHTLSNEIYRELDKDLSITLERKMNSLLLQLAKRGSLSLVLYKSLHSSGGNTPLLYGLQKIHKPDIPLHPIVSFVHSPTYQQQNPNCYKIDKKSSVQYHVQYSKFIYCKSQFTNVVGFGHRFVG